MFRGSGIAGVGGSLPEMLDHRPRLKVPGEGFCSILGVKCPHLSGGTYSALDGLRAAYRATTDTNEWLEVSGKANLSMHEFKDVKSRESR